MEKTLNKRDRPKEESNIVTEKVEEYRRKSIYYAKKKPKVVFYGMVLLTIISIIGNLIYYQYTVKNAKISYSKMNEKIFNKDFTRISSKQDASITQQASDYFTMKKDLDVLKELQVKKELSKQDSVEAIRIVEKYNLK